MRMVTAFLVLGLAAGCASSSTTPPPMTSSIPARSDVTWDLANIPHWRVDHWIEQFTRGEKRAEFATYLDRKGQYESMIRGKLRARQMPEDLVYLAMIESGFNPEAHSAQAARGIWQLIPDTARRYKLRVDDEVD